MYQLAMISEAATYPVLFWPSSLNPPEFTFQRHRLLPEMAMPYHTRCPLFIFWVALLVIPKPENACSFCSRLSTNQMVLVRAHEHPVENVVMVRFLCTDCRRPYYNAIYSSVVERSRTLLEQQFWLLKLRYLEGAT